MNHKQKTYTAKEAEKMADEVGDFDSSPKHLKREILALKRELTIRKKDYANVLEYIRGQDYRIKELEDYVGCSNYE